MSGEFAFTASCTRRFVLASLAAVCLAGLTVPAGARAPDGVSPGKSCLNTYIGSHMQEAKKLDRAKQKARGNWEYQAWRKFGARYDDWKKAQLKQYGCSKKGKRHFCIAEAYPCSQIEEVGG
jgi:hypothetical protein